MLNKLNLFKKKPQKEEETDDKSGEYTVKSCPPAVRSSFLDNGLVQVEIFIPGLEPGLEKHQPKGGRISFDFYNKGYGFDMRAEFVDKVKKVKTVHHFYVKKLPGRVDTAESKWDVVKGKIIITMEKHPADRNIDWKSACQLRGLDQLSSSSSSDDD
ncbi:unnamed protein product [Candidula unifasciata]|uniref:Uncharacterized protein n=1 Tax=Candidula unifasciata TaxID=100452 RepID=A0A8S4A9G5_9EUPU|nr:unnamed protein product [Candidula unifasciata]